MNQFLELYFGLPTKSLVRLCGVTDEDIQARVFLFVYIKWQRNLI
jgi:hypothetical protein